MASYGADTVNNIMDAFEMAREAIGFLPPLPPGIKPVHIRVLTAMQRILARTGQARVSDINDALGYLLPNTTRFINELVGLKVVKKSGSSADEVCQDFQADRHRPTGADKDRHGGVGGMGMDETSILYNRQRTRIMLPLLLGGFISLLNETLLHVAFPQLMASLRVPTSTIQQIAAAFGSSLFIGLMGAVEARQLAGIESPDASQRQAAVVSGVDTAFAAALVVVLVGLVLSLFAKGGRKQPSGAGLSEDFPAPAIPQSAAVQTPVDTAS